MQLKLEASKRPKSEENKGEIVYQPHDEPAFFDLHVEMRHTKHLGKKTLDKEGKLQVMYRILKDQLRSAKRQLLTIKKNNTAEN